MLHEVSFLSYNERDNVKGWIYVPACKPRGILQIVHGFGEHSRRYLHMIVAMMDAGFIVAADDHVGHGKTAVENPGTWGDWGDKGYRTMMEDEHRLTQIVKENILDCHISCMAIVWAHLLPETILPNMVLNWLAVSCVEPVVRSRTGRKQETFGKTAG